MSWYPGANRMELQPESDNQPKIRPTQFIMHSVAAPWDEKRIYAYWRDSTNLESHFGLDYDGSMGQFIGTETRADANALANLRPDGTGAVSIETASDLRSSDPWTEAQVRELIRLGAWLHRTHGIPLRICRTHDDPGYGFHSLFPEWSISGTSCPGTARIRQFRGLVFPGIAAACTPQPQETPVALTSAEIDRIATAAAEKVRWFVVDDPFKSDNAQTTLGGLWWETAVRVSHLPTAPLPVALTDAQIEAIAVAVAAKLNGPGV